MQQILSKHQQFCEENNLDFEPSDLKLLCSITFCPSCYETSSSQHKPTCPELRLNPTTKTQNTKTSAAPSVQNSPDNNNSEIDVGGISQSIRSSVNQGDDDADPDCLSSQNDGYVTAMVFKHNPPRLDGCFMADAQCKACILAKQASPSYSIVRFCEHDLCGVIEQRTDSDSEHHCGEGVTLLNNEASVVEQIAYQLEMCGEEFLVSCPVCLKEVSRDSYHSHVNKCSSGH